MVDVLEKRGIIFQEQVCQVQCPEVSPILHRVSLADTLADHHPIHHVEWNKYGDVPKLSLRKRSHHFPFLDLLLGEHVTQILVIVSSLAFLAATATNHHIHERSGKEDIPRIRDFLKGTPYFLFSTLSRCSILALLAAYMQGWTVLLMVILVVTNLIIASLVFKTDKGKNVWTAFASVLVPICFVSKDTIAVYERSLANPPAKKFRQYYLLNSLAFAFYTLSGMGILHWVLTEQMIEYDCHNLPILSCQRIIDDASCNTFRRSCSGTETTNPHEAMLSYGWVWIGVLNGLSIVLTIFMNKAFPVLRGDLAALSPM